MALDVHVSDSADNASKEWPVCAFELDVHNALFGNKTIVPRSFTQLLKIKNYWEDTQYSEAELDVLVTEIEHVLPKFTGPSAIVTALTSFRDACLRARADNKTVFVFCD